MNVWRWCGALVMLAVSGIGFTAAGGGKDDKLVWKAFDDKSPAFYQEMTTKTDQTMKVQNMEVKQSQKQTFYIKWTPKAADTTTWTVEQEIIGVKMDIEIGGNKISYDSTKEAPANPLTDFFKALIGAKFKLIINKDTMKVGKIEGRQEFVQKLAKANEQLKPLLEAILSEDALKQMTDPTFAVIPEKGVIPSDKKPWERINKLSMGPIGTYTTTHKYTHVEVKDKIDEIKVETSLTYEAPTKDKSSGLPFIIREAKLGSTKGSGKVLFDRDKGRIKSSTMDLELSGDLTIEIAGLPTTVNLNQVQNSTLVTMDANPIEAPKK